MRFVVVCLVVGLFSGCASVTPISRHENSEISFDGNDQNSGIIDFREGGILITPRAKQAYDELATAYGKLLVPKVTPGFGVKPEGENWLMTYEAFMAWHELGIRREQEMIRKSGTLLNKVK